MDTISEEGKIALKDCEDIFCKACIEDYLTLKINEKGFPIKCPKEGCGKKFDEAEDIKKILSPEMVEKYDEFKIKHFLETHSTEVIVCPTPDCKYYKMKEMIEEDEFKCKECEKVYCSSCLRVPHPESSCEEVDEFMDHAQENEYQKCPDCKMWIYKFEGCEKVICPCGAHFCYICGAEGFSCEHDGAYDDGYGEDEEY
mmetsp:Transcript_15161/g.12906  ORF Transcript_15161/g.12906 Transcript_15161/m.12906 type:complete len:199 (-) Transcript_15161:120-716(-)